jgi:predicted amino acid-binding ACT domain protein
MGAKYCEQRKWHRSFVETSRERSSNIFEMLKQVWFSEGRKKLGLTADLSVSQHQNHKNIKQVKTLVLNDCLTVRMIAEELDVSRDFISLTENLRMKKVCAMIATKNLIVLYVKEFLVKILAIFSRTPCLLTESHDV